MMQEFPVRWRGLAGVVTLGWALAAVGCGYQAPQFRPNRVPTVAQQGQKQALTDAQVAELNDVLTSLFGTPDDPHVPVVHHEDPAQAAALNAVLNEAQLKIAAGPVGRNAAGQQQGLYREHCAHCHGVTGDGQGPTGVYLNPYPRDYRKGVYKFKSTPKGIRPTHADLKRTLDEGIPGTAMPSFKLLHDDQVEALIAYVKYLSLRGAVEIRLTNYIFENVDVDDKNNPEMLLDPKWRDSADKAEQDKFIERLDAIKGEVAKEFVTWAAAEALAVEVPPRPVHKSPEDLAASIKRGNELFHGGIAICIKCHGETALGDGQMTDYDDWTKDWFDVKNAEAKQASLAIGLAHGALPPRNIIPRNLRVGNLRGGHRPVDLYWRIVNGIDGTPMPAATMRKPGGAATELNLTPEDVWSIVDYVQSLPYEPLSQRQHLVENVRDDKF